MVAGVGEVEIIVAVNGDGSREIELGGGGGAVVPGETRGFNAGDGGDGAGSGVDATDSMIVGVGEEEVAEGVEGEAVGGVERGGGGGAVVAGEALRTGAGDDGDVAGSVNFSDEVAGGFSQVEVACVVEDDGGRKQDGDGEGGCLSGCELWRDETEQEREWAQETSGAKEGWSALRTHESWPGFGIRIENLFLTLPHEFSPAGCHFRYSGLGAKDRYCDCR